MPQSNPQTKRLRELRAADIISEESYQLYRRMAEAINRGLRSLAAELDVPVAELLGFDRRFVACYARSRHLFPDNEFWVLREDKTSFIADDVCDHCGMLRRYRRSKVDFLPMTGYRYIKPVGFDFTGVSGRTITRREASVVFSWIRLEKTIERLAAGNNLRHLALAN